MRKLLLSVLVLSGAYLEGFETSASSENATQQELCLNNYSMKGPYQKEQEKKQKKINKNQPAQVVGLGTFISAVANGEQVGQTVAINNPIIFNSTTAQNGTVENADNGVLIVVGQGAYEVQFGASWTSADPSSFIALRLNGNVIEESRISSTQSTKGISLILNNSEKRALFEVINASTNSDITLVSDIDGRAPSAYITVKKIN